MFKYGRSAVGKSSDLILRLQAQVAEDATGSTLLDPHGPSLGIWINKILAFSAAQQLSFSDTLLLFDLAPTDAGMSFDPFKLFREETLSVRNRLRQFYEYPIVRALLEERPERQLHCPDSL